MINWRQRLDQIASKSSRLVAGIMSGTSADAVDIALCQISGFGLSAKIHLVHFYTHPYQAALQKTVKTAANLTLQDVSELNVGLGNLFAEATIAAIASAKLNIADLDLIGSHGQTVFHHSGKSAIKSTLQLGDADIIAQKVACLVVADFRAKDIALGGEGAPLTPYTDAVLFSGAAAGNVRRAVLNLGGIANITILASDPNKIIGFDTGPANAPLDRIAARLSNGKLTCDLDGALAAQGKVNLALVERLLKQDAFISRPPPKSTGFEAYGDSFVDMFIKEHGQVDNDLLANATEFVARSIALAVSQYSQAAKLDELVVAGGGVKNKFLIARIAQLVAPIKVKTSDELGVPHQAREAMAFAILANDMIAGCTTSLPSVTGAVRGGILGKLSVPEN